MKSSLIHFLLLLIFTGPIFAEEGVNKVSKFKMKTALGTLTSERNEIITSNIKVAVHKNKGKWKGIAGKILGKFYPKGSEEIINLDENKIHKLNRKKKKCETRPLITEETKEAQKGLKDALQQMKAVRDSVKVTYEEARKENIEILAQEFRVDNLNETVTHNDFLCQQFLITTFTKQRDKDTGIVRVDSASIRTDMTKLTDEIRKALEIEKTFSKNYFEKLGLDFNFTTRGLFGGDALEKFKQAQKDEDISFTDHPNIKKQISKFDGYYPVFTHGELYGFVLNKKGKEEEEKEEDEKTDLKKIKKKGFGFAKRLIKKKKDKPTGPVPFFEFDDELIKLVVTNYTQNELHPPFKCKEKK